MNISDLTPVPGRAGYFASRDGRVYSARGRAIKEMSQLAGSKNRTYRYVNLGRNVRIGVHQIVALCFLPPPEMVEGKMQNVVRHRDNNPSNNHADNLRWGTQKENLADRAEHGTLTRGERNGQSKISADVVEEIRKRRAAGETCRSIAATLSISASQVHRIGLGQRWASVSHPTAPRQRFHGMESVNAGAQP